MLKEVDSTTHMPLHFLFNLSLPPPTKTTMGLQGHLNDAASDSIPLYLVALIAAFFRHLRSIFLSSSPAGSSESDPFSLVGSGLAGLVLLSDQLSLNRRLSHNHAASPRASDCIFCLSDIRDGDRVRKLSCSHVFHKDCLDAWLDQMRFSCPLCRSSVVSPTRVDSTRRRLADQLVHWFAVQ